MSVYLSVQLVTPYLALHLIAETEVAAHTWVSALKKSIRSSDLDLLPEATRKAAVVAVSRSATPRARAASMSKLSNVDQSAIGEEYHIRYNEKRSLGMKLKPKTRKWVVVTAAMRDTNIIVGSVLSAVNGRPVEDLGYNATIRILKDWTPPLLLTFRNTPVAGGFLKEFHTASGKWRLRYCHLQSNTLQIYSTKEKQQPAHAASEPSSSQHQHGLLSSSRKGGGKRKGRGHRASFTSDPTSAFPFIETGGLGNIDSRDNNSDSGGSGGGGVSDPTHEPVALTRFVNLEGACLRELPRKELGQELCLQLVAGSGKVVLQAATPEELVQWCAHIYYAMSMANDGMFVRRAEEEQRTRVSSCDVLWLSQQLLWFISGLSNRVPYD
jgi:hypothetical protein